MQDVEVAVIGAGQAGLSAGYFLRKFGFEPDVDMVMVDHAKRAGGAWQYRWPSLKLDRVHGLHDLPGLPLGRSDGAKRASEVVSDYFSRYEKQFGLAVHRPVSVGAVRYGYDDVADRLIVESTEETWAARAVINATGTWDRPFWPYYPGQEKFSGQQIHTADYQTREQFRDQDVVIVGGGTSALELLLEISAVARNTLWVTRRPPVFRQGPFTHEDGRAAVAKVDRAVRAGKPPESVVWVTDLTWTPELRAARDAGILDRQPMFSRITVDGVEWSDGRRAHADSIVWATGFRAALDHLAPLHLRESGGGITMIGTQVAAEPRLHLLGYGPSASTIGANRAGRTAAREVSQLLRRTSRSLS